MAIQKLEIHGYRSFEHATWEPGGLNLLVGPNASGKSNLLRLLELVSLSAQGKLSKAVNAAGGMIPLLWDQQASSLAFRVRVDPVDPGRDTVKDAITIELELQQLAGGSAYAIGRDALGNWYSCDRGTDSSPLWIYRRDAGHAIVFDQKSNDLIPFDDFEANESLLSQIADPRTNPIPTFAKRVLETWCVYHDVGVGSQSPIRLPVITQPATVVEQDGSNLAAVLHTLYTGNRDFEQKVNDGMFAGFGPEYVKVVFQPAAAQRIQLAVQWRSSQQPHAGQELSDGTLRFLFLLTVLADPDPPPLIAIDEPEVGLHPSMFPIIAEYAAAAAERTQVVITSHSAEFLDAFTTLEPHVTVCHWEQGRTHLFQIPPEKLNPWLEKYRLGHLFTSGELDILAAPEVDVPEDMERRFADLPPEQLPSASGPVVPEGGADG